MSTSLTNQRACVALARLRPRHGTSSLEAVVAFTLLTTVLSVSLPLVVRHGRLLAANRDYRLALDEVSNQIDRLTALPADDVPRALEQLKVSPFTAERLSDAELHGELKPADIGGHVTLRLSWDGPHGHTVSMAAWVFPTRPQTGNRGPGDEES